MRPTAAVLLAVVALTLVGCGDSSGDESKNEATPEPQVAKPLSGVAEFKACAKKAGAEVKPKPPTLDGRIAVGGAGNLPATYVGVVVFPNGAYMDVWLADNAADGAATADKLNEAEATSQGVTEVEAAFNNGRAVGAPGNTEAFGELGGNTAEKIDGCLQATNG
jgi:hypothetical protein